MPQLFNATARSISTLISSHNCTKGEPNWVSWNLNKTHFGDAPRYSLDLSIAQPVGELPTNADSRSPRLNLTYFYQFE